SILHVIFIVIISSFVIGTLVVWFFSAHIASSINAVANRMDLVAQADLSQADLQIESKDETGRLANSLNDMQNNLKNMIGNVHDASTTIASQSEELTQAAGEVSEGSEQI